LAILEAAQTLAQNDAAAIYQAVSNHFNFIAGKEETSSKLFND